MTVPLEARQQMEAVALREYEAALGTVVETDWVYGYRGDSDHTVEISFDPPVKVRVVKTDQQSIAHWNDRYLDPYWDVEVFESRPELEGIRSLWIDGPSHEYRAAEEVTK